MSTSESKKKSPSSSSKHSKKEHHDESNDDNRKDKKKSDEIPVEEVHTANNWEGADLGDDQRKQKFLRLMGAKKRKEESRTDTKDSHEITPDDDQSPEKKHCRSKRDTETINRDLEKQFNEGLQAKIAHIHHGGLGFHGSGNSSATSSGDWQHQSTKETFVPATTAIGASLDHVIVDKTENVEDKSGDKVEKKKKSKS